MRQGGADCRRRAPRIETRTLVRTDEVDRDVPVSRSSAGIHYGRDVALRKDSRSELSNLLPRGMAACKNLAISILWLPQLKNIKYTINRVLRQGGGPFPTPREWSSHFHQIGNFLSIRHNLPVDSEH